MRVVYLHQYFNTPAMTGGTRSYEMARRLVAAGIKVDLVTTWREPSGQRSWFATDEAGIRVHWLPLAYSNRMNFIQRMTAFVRFAWASARKASSLEADVVFATSTPLTIALPAIYAAWRRRVPMVFEVRDLWPDVPIAIGAIRNPVLVWLARGLESLAYRYASHIIVLAPGMGEDIARSGVPPAKISIIPNGCDLDVFSAVPPGRSPREEFQWLGSRKLVLFAGTLGRVNGVGYLVRLARRVADIDPEIRFVVIGDGAERDAIRLEAQSCGLLGTTFFMLDPLAKRDLARWLHTADLMVALFTGPRVVWKDAVQNKFFDALAAGRPVASNFDGWQSRVALEAGVGFILDPADLYAAAKKLVDTLRDEEWLAAVPARARSLAESRFERGRLAGLLEQVLRDAAGSGK